MRLHPVAPFRRDWQAMRMARETVIISIDAGIRIMDFF